MCAPIGCLGTRSSTLSNGADVETSFEHMTSYFHLASIGRRLVELDAGRELVRRGLERALGSHGPLAGILTDDQSRLDAFGRHAHHHADAELFHVLVEVLSVDLSIRAQTLEKER